MALDAGKPTPSPGVLLMGLCLMPVALFSNPWLLAHVWPRLFLAVPDFWWPLLAVHVLLVVLVARLTLQWRVLGRTRLAQAIFHPSSWVGGMLLSLLAILSLLVLTEVFFWRLHRVAQRHPAPSADNTYSVPLYGIDPVLGSCGLPGASTTHRCLVQPSGETLFEKVYHLDAEGNRVVPQGDAPKSQHLAVFGCSFAFGIGANDEETFPARLAAGSPETHVYNFAFGGYSPAETALQLVGGVTNTVTEPRGAAVYLLMSDHVNRFLPRIHYATTWTRTHPTFRLDAKGEAHYFGCIDTAYPWRMNWLDFATNEHFVAWSGMDFPMQPSVADYDLGGAMLAAARKEYRRRFPENEFFVLLYPDCHGAFNSSAIEESLDRRGVIWLSAGGLFGDTPERYEYRLDRHPTPEAHELLAHWFWARFPQGLLAGPTTGGRAPRG